MAGKKPNYYPYQTQKSYTPWIRGNSSKVAVKPERITTLLEVAIEYYGKECARCGSKKSLTVHHRHYRTVGFEKPETDIVLLCQECHNDLHERGRQKRLNRNDVPYVDPKWEDWLSKLPPKEERPQGRFAGVDPSLIREWKAVFRDAEGQEWVVLDSNVTYEDAVRSFSACLEIWDLVEIVSIEDYTDKVEINGMFMSFRLEPHQRDLLERPQAHRPRPSEASPPPQLTDPGEIGDGDA